MVGNERPELTLDDITVSERRRRDVDRFVCRNHYLDGQPSPQTIYRYVISGGLYHGWIGGAMWGKPVARMEDQKDTLELLRFWTVDWTPKNTESYAIGQMIQDIDRKGTHSRLIAYASTGQDHDGGIYKATNWEDCGVRETNTGDGWKTRENRANDDPSKKRKFEYLL
jgi:hypothetical protein